MLALKQNCMWIFHHKSQKIYIWLDCTFNPIQHIYRVAALLQKGENYFSKFLIEEITITYWGEALKNYYNGYSITWILHQIFMSGNKVKLVGGLSYPPTQQRKSTFYIHIYLFIYPSIYLSICISVYLVIPALLEALFSITHLSLLK